MIVYNKLVRDRIPEIIRAEGKTCDVRTLSTGDYVAKLTEKLREEVEEFAASGTPEELVDLAEVLDALVRASGLTVDEFAHLRAEKRQARGGFDDRLLLVSVFDEG